MAIPKIIHYCWFGGNPMPKILRYCVNSWKQLLPEYEFMFWNENNTTFDCEFIKTAYSQKKWAFVSDYVRLKAVCDHGGIYMDTDMLLLKSLDDFLNNECFFVAEHPKSINASIFGAMPNNGFIGLCLETYRKEDAALLPIPTIVSIIFLKKYKLERKFKETIVLKDIVIYAPDYFYCLPYNKLFDIHNYKKYLTKNSYGVHLWHGSWHSYNELVLLRRKEYSKAFTKILNTIFKKKKFGFLYVKKVMVAFKDSLVTPNAFK
ncbi:MAG: mannosyltransferase [Aequorivita sp.]|nr:MAG: mannosyltransferase [Aequorivita sp.]